MLGLAFISGFLARLAMRHEQFSLMQHIHAATVWSLSIML
jgi:hypothetical protein